jgi:hypothetical protein
METPTLLLARHKLMFRCLGTDYFRVCKSAAPLKHGDQRAHDRDDHCISAEFTPRPHWRRSQIATSSLGQWSGSDLRDCLRKGRAE